MRFLGPHAAGAPAQGHRSEGRSERQSGEDVEHDVLPDGHCRKHDRHEPDDVGRPHRLRRTDPRFWTHSDSLHAAYRKSAPIEAGTVDYNRYENR